jgi:hypothetical protein
MSAKKEITGPAPATLARWQRNRPYTKLWGETASRVILARIPWRTKAIYYGLQTLFGQTELAGALIKDGKPMPLASLAIQLGTSAKPLEEDLDALVSLGVIDRDNHTGAYFDRTMVHDEIVQLWEKFRKMKPDDKRRGGISITLNALQNFLSPREANPWSCGNPTNEMVVQDSKSKTKSKRRGDNKSTRTLTRSDDSTKGAQDDSGDPDGPSPPALDWDTLKEKFQKEFPNIDIISEFAKWWDREHDEGRTPKPETSEKKLRGWFRQAVEYQEKKASKPAKAKPEKAKSEPKKTKKQIEQEAKEAEEAAAEDTDEEPYEDPLTIEMLEYIAELPWMLTRCFWEDVAAKFRKTLKWVWDNIKPDAEMTYLVIKANDPRAVNLRRENSTGIDVCGCAYFEQLKEQAEQQAEQKEETARKVRRQKEDAEADQLIGDNIDEFKNWASFSPDVITVNLRNIIKTKPEGTYDKDTIIRALDRWKANQQQAAPALAPQPTHLVETAPVAVEPEPESSPAPVIEPSVATPEAKPIQEPKLTPRQEEWHRKRLERIARLGPEFFRTSGMPHEEAAA